MKNTKSLLLLCMLQASIQTIATVRTVSNLGGSQYSTLQAAYTASANGDTLMIEGSANVYNGVGGSAWDKSLVVIGSGYNANKQNFVPVSICTYCNGLALNFTAGAAGSKFYGISTDDLNISGISYLQFHDCKFGSVQGNISNCTFKNCVFTGTDYNLIPSNVTNLTISNCIFNGRILYNNSGYSIANFIIDHCLFLRTANYLFDTNGGCPRNTVIKNSILMNCTAAAPACSTSNLSFVNCVSRNNLSTSGITTASGLAFTSYTNGSFWSTSHDYHCTDAAIVLAGDDGTDIGLHGGTANFSEKGEPLIVNIVRTITVGNTAPPNGTLNVTITAGKPTDQ